MDHAGYFALQKLSNLSRVSTASSSSDSAACAGWLKAASHVIQKGNDATEPEVSPIVHHDHDKLKHTFDGKTHYEATAKTLWKPNMQM